MTLFRSYADDMALMDWLQNRIWPLEARLDGRAVYWGSLLGIGEMIRTGTTCFADMYFFMEETAKRRRTAASGPYCPGGSPAAARKTEPPGWKRTPSCTKPGTEPRTAGSP